MFFDYAGNITSSTDGEGNTTTYAYNSINQLSMLTDPMGQQESYAYDEEERLCRKEDRNGTVTKYSYNMYGNLLARRARKPEDTEELSEVYEYTAEGLLKSALSQGMRYSYTYDVMDRLMRKMASGRTLLALDYDRNGNMISQTDVTGKVMEYHYDVTDRLSEVWDNGRKIAGYEYHGDGTVKRLQCGSLYTEYDYDIDRNLTGLRTMLGNEIIADNHYRYDGNGNRLEKQQKYGTTRYTYDSMNRLAKVEYPDRKEELFYDKAGNRTRRVMNGMEELYRYDKRNRLTEYTKGGATHQFSYDNAGNLIRDDRAKYEYDAFNRNTKVETFNGNIQINHYDAEGLRHEMEENGRLVSFIFRGTEVVTEETKEDRIRYIRTNELLASDAESARTYYHYASDEIGNITHVVNDTNVINYYEYDSWGNLTVCEETIENRFKYNGQQFDPISQQYYLRARYYNPVIGRFTQEDTYRGDGLNLYAYCRNNPIVYIDPGGNICETAANRIREKVANNTATKNEQRKLAAYDRNKARLEAQDYSDIRAYDHIDIDNIPMEYRADPRLVAEMDYKGEGRGANAAGWERNAKKHFEELLRTHPEYWSQSNKQKIRDGKNPKVDAQFAYYFPQYADYMENKLLHHHIGGGGQATAVPSGLHNGYGGIHNVEKKHGIRGNDKLSEVGKVFQPTRMSNKKKRKK